MVLNIRQSHNRLAVAVGLSAVVTGALLEAVSTVIGNFHCSEDWCSQAQEATTVYLLPEVPEPVSENVLPDREIRQGTRMPQDVVSPGPSNRSKEGKAAKLGVDRVRPVNSTPARDWFAVARDVAEQSVADRFAHEENRASMWRRTGSVMFRDTGEFDLQEPATIIADREFRVPVGVLGLGVTIGGCFIGIPLAGIPVERRSAGPTVFYCTDIYE